MDDAALRAPPVPKKRAGRGGPPGVRGRGRAFERPGGAGLGLLDEGLILLLHLADADGGVAASGGGSRGVTVAALGAGLGLLDEGLILLLHLADADGGVAASGGRGRGVAVAALGASL